MSQLFLIIQDLHCGLNTNQITLHIIKNKRKLEKSERQIKRKKVGWLGDEEGRRFKCFSDRSCS